jgi:dihydrofolate reductase
MQTVTVDFIISLDGYGAAEGWPGFWGMEGPEYLPWLDESPDKNDTLLMGANTYRLMGEFAASGEQGSSALTDAPKIVFSSTLHSPLSWANTRLVSGDAVEAVREMKKSAERPMRTLGSLSLSRDLLRASLVDRFRVVIFPVITGATGTERIFDGYPDLRLELVKSHLFDGRLQLLEYVPTTLEPRT